MNKNTKQPRYDLLYEAILKLKTPEECIKFFEDLCSITELRAMEQRFQVAEIVRETGASTATISRVNRSLHYGSDGYEIVFSRLDEEKGQ